jgi:hypothetical protein
MTGARSARGQGQCSFPFPDIRPPPTRPWPSLPPSWRPAWWSFWSPHRSRQRQNRKRQRRRIGLPSTPIACPSAPREPPAPWPAGRTTTWAASSISGSPPAKRGRLGPSRHVSGYSAGRRSNRRSNGDADQVQAAAVPPHAPARAVDFHPLARGPFHVGSPWFDFDAGRMDFFRRFDISERIEQGEVINDLADAAAGEGQARQRGGQQQAGERRADR